MTPFDGFRRFFRTFLVVHISPTRTGVLTSHHPQSHIRVEGIHTRGCCPAPRRDHLRRCCHYLSVIKWLTSWLLWVGALFAVLRRCPLRDVDAWGWILEECVRSILYMQYIQHIRSRGSSVSVVSDYRLHDRTNRVRSPTEAKDFSCSLRVQTSSEAHPASCTMGTGSSFLGIANISQK
jgi:hypothetical protein